MTLCPDADVSALVLKCLPARPYVGSCFTEITIRKTLFNMKQMQVLMPSPSVDTKFVWSIHTQIFVSTQIYFFKLTQFFKHTQK